MCPLEKVKACHFRSAIRFTKSAVEHDLGGLRRSYVVCKSLKNQKRKDCHSRGRGFEPRRLQHKSPKIQWFMAEPNSDNPYQGMTRDDSRLLLLQAAS